jgi:hypothetical protein
MLVLRAPSSPRPVRIIQQQLVPTSVHAPVDRDSQRHAPTTGLARNALPEFGDTSSTGGGLAIRAGVQ